MEDSIYDKQYLLNQLRLWLQRVEQECPELTADVEKFIKEIEYDQTTKTNEG